MIIETQDLRKTFQSRGEAIEAVRGLDLVVHEGEVFGLLGPNGAGKTTTVRMLATLMTATSGRATVVDVDVLQDPAAARPHIGYVSQAGGVDTGMSARVNLQYQARLCRLSRADAERQTAHLLERFELESVADRPTATLSGGQRQRLALALGIVHRPRLLFLDEPTTGIDPQGRARLWDEIRALHADGTTILLTTHYLEEADALCDRLAIIDNGTVVAGGTPAELKRRISGDVVTIRLDDIGQRELARAVLDGMPGTRQIDEEGDLLRVYIRDGDQALPSLVRMLDQQDVEVTALTLASPSLDDVFLQQTGRSLRETTV